MSQNNPSNPNNLPGIVTDQPEIYESETALSDDTGINDVDLVNDQRDEGVTLIEVPTRQAFAYFAERENEIAQFYVQRYGEYKNHSDLTEEETDIEKYHRLVSEVNQLLSKFQSNKAKSSDHDATIKTGTFTTKLEVLSRQLKALEFAAEDGSMDPCQSGFVEIESKLDKLRKNISDSDPSDKNHPQMVMDDTGELIRMGALEHRLSALETFVGKDEQRLQSLFRETKSDNLIDAAETLASWLAIFQENGLQGVSGEIDYLVLRLQKLNEQAALASEEGSKGLNAQSKGKLEHLYNLVTATDKQRAMVPTIVHRLNAMEELQKKASNFATTVSYLEQVQAQILDSLQANKGELSSLAEMFSTNMELIKQFSKDIDARILSIREKD